MKITIAFVISALSWISAAGGVSAQSFSIDRYAIAGGGGASAGGGFTLNGTVGQPDAGPQPLSDGRFSLAGGFWSLVAVPTAGAPALSVERQGAVVRVFWPLSAATGFVLEQSPTAIGAWTPVTSPYVTNATDISLSVPSPTGQKFYRLRKP